MKRGKLKPDYDFRDFGNGSLLVLKNRHLAIYHVDTAGCDFWNRGAGQKKDKALV